jgi:Fe-S cluster assembly protein SufD
MSAELAVIRSAAEEAIVARFPDVKQHEAHWGGPFVARLRDEAFSTLKAHGLPTRRVEEWKYTDLRALMRDLPERAQNPSPETVQAAESSTPSLPVKDATRILFVNGECFATLKEDGFDFSGLREGGDEIGGSIAEAVSRKRDYAANAAVALNTAFMRDCIVLRVPAGVQLARPLHLEFRDLGDKPFATYPRVLLVIEKGASATLIETHDGPNGVGYQTTALIEVEIGDGGKLEHVRHNSAGDKALALSTFGVRLGKDATISSLSVTTGAAVSRHQVFATFAGTGGTASIRGATLLRGRQHSDSTLVINHAIGHGESRELFKSVLDGESRGVFQGKIIVAPGAQKTDGKMAAHALLLSEEAEADSKPELEIFADDVVCGHGSTAGALDDELLFYLKARGIPQKEAEALMVQAFVGEAIEPVENEALRESLTAAVEQWLKART